MTQRFLEALTRLLGDSSVITDPDVMLSHSSDQACTVAPGVPLAVAFPTSTDEVSATLALAVRHDVPVVPRGAGTGLAGGATATTGCLVLSLTRMDSVVDLDPEARWIVVQPGTPTRVVKQRAEEAGLWYPPDPASWSISSIGGNLATNAGGLCCVRYGVTGDYVLALEVVLASGAVLRTGSLTRKGVAGYDLTRLFVGSEGTLGIITEATLRLEVPRRQSVTVVALYEELTAAGAAVLEVLRRVPSTSLLELMDRATLQAVERATPMGFAESYAALLIAQCEGSEDASALHDALAATSQECHATSDAAEAGQLLAARRMAYPALESLGSTLLDDVALPVPALPAMLRRTAEISQAQGVLIGTFGHAGDGNLHPTIVFDATDAREVRRAHTAFEELLATALELGGTITGEHGVGSLKAPWLAREIGEVGMHTHRAIKAALDPKGILNPGKVLP